MKSPLSATGAEAVTSPARALSRLPHPDRLWIRFAPRVWPGPAGPWTDLARAGLGESTAGASTAVAGPLDDLLYLPPVPAERAAERDRAAAEHLAAGTPVLVQLAPGDGPAPAGALAVYDLLAALVAGDPDALGRLPAGCAAVWPLLPGLTDDRALWRRGLERLAAAGVSVVVGMVLILDPAARRRLAEGHGDEAFQALFHRPPPSERDFARAVLRSGLAPLLPRPLPRPPLRGADNRRLAEALILAAELWLSVGRPVGQGLALARAGRWVDGSPYDVAALAREGNLGVVHEIDAMGRGLIEHWVRGGGLPLLDELLADYGGGER